MSSIASSASCEISFVQLGKEQYMKRLCLAGALVAPGSTPAFNISVNAGAALYGLAFDGSGNLWTVDNNSDIWEIKAPITSSSTATQVLTGMQGYGIAFGP